MKQQTFGWNEDTMAPAELAVSEQPQVRFEKFGGSALSDTEILALVLQGHQLNAAESFKVASLLLAEAKSLPDLLAWTAADYRRVKGIGYLKSIQLSVIAEMARRLMAARVSTTAVLNRASLVAEYFYPITAGLAVEKFWVLCLNRKNRLLKLVEVSSGTATSALAHPREVFRAAVRESAAGIICVHNHPSGDPAPSAPDLQVTRVMREAGRTVDIDLLDHVIVGRPELDPTGNGFFSFREAGMV